LYFAIIQKKTKGKIMAEDKKKNKKKSLKAIAGSKDTSLKIG
jgi:hypothetical protein